jgi:hypothetical protein
MGRDAMRPFGRRDCLPAQLAGCLPWRVPDVRRDMEWSQKGQKGTAIQFSTDLS